MSVSRWNAERLVPRVGGLTFDSERLRMDYRESDRASGWAVFVLRHSAVQLSRLCVLRPVPAPRGRDPSHGFVHFSSSDVCDPPIRRKSLQTAQCPSNCVSAEINTSHHRFLFPHLDESGASKNNPTRTDFDILAHSGTHLSSYFLRNLGYIKYNPEPSHSDSSSPRSRLTRDPA